MAHWKERFLGITELPKELSPLEIEEFFTLPPTDLKAITEQFRPKYRIAVAIQLCFIRLSGTQLASFTVFPRPLLQFVGSQLQVEIPTIASFRAIYKRKQTRFEHQSWAVERLGLKTATKRQEAMLLAAIREASAGTSSTDRLFDLSCRWLVDRKLLIPGLRAVRDICFRASSDTEENIYVAICKSTTEEQRKAWTEALLSPRKQNRTTLEWLQRPPKRRSPKHVSALFEKIEFLKELGIADFDLPGVSPQRLQDYARSMRNRSATSFKRLTGFSQTLQLVAFLKVILGESTDMVIQLTGKLTSNIKSQALENANKAQAVASVSYGDALNRVFEIAKDEKLDVDALRKKIREIEESIVRPVFPTIAAAVRSELADKSSSIRPILKRLAGLEIKGDKDDKGLAGLAVLRDLYDKTRSELPDGVLASSKIWDPLIADQKDRERAFRAFEADTLLNLRKSFRRGSAWVDHSNTFRDRDTLLIPSADWEKQRRRHYDLLRLPTNVDDYLGPLINAVKKGLKEVQAAVTRGDLDIEGGTFNLDKLEAEGEPPEVQAIRSLIDTEIGNIQLPDLLLQMDVETRFSKELLGHLPKNDRDLLLSYAGLLGLGTDMTATGVAMMMSDLSPEDVSGAMKHLEFDNATTKANELVLQYLNRLPITSVWGDGKSASSDMMSLSTSKHLWNARLDPRRKTASIGMYTHVHDRWSIIYHQPVVLGERQVGAAIEGIIRQTELDLNRLAVDTHGYSDVGMAISHGLGFDLCPRLANMPSRRLTVPRDFTVPEGIKELVDTTINLDHIRSHWDDYVRVLASISNGTISAVTALQRFGSAAQGDPLYRAANQLGRLLRTIFLCDFLTKPDFRRELTRLLNRGEHVHTLQHAIHLGSVRPERGRRPDEMIAISGSLTLLSNLVIAWNATRIQTAVTSLEAKGFTIPKDCLRHISPVRYAGVNLRGTFKFAIDLYRSHLIIDGAPRLKMIRSN